MDETEGMGERRTQEVTRFLSLDGGWWKVPFKVGKKKYAWGQREERWTVF